MQPTFKGPGIWSDYDLLPQQLAGLVLLLNFFLLLIFCLRTIKPTWRNPSRKLSYIAITLFCISALIALYQAISYGVIVFNGASSRVEFHPRGLTGSGSGLATTRLYWWLVSLSIPLLNLGAALRHLRQWSKYSQPTTLA
jgi:uncharacterized membrane protein